MRITQTYHIADASIFKLQALKWAASFPHVCCLDSNNYQEDPFSKFEYRIALSTSDADVLKWTFTDPKGSDPFQELNDFYTKKQDWLFGFLSYDLKNAVEKLSSNNLDSLQMPDLYFFQPAVVLTLYKDNSLEISSIPTFEYAHNQILEQIEATHPELPILPHYLYDHPHLTPRLSHAEYIKRVEQVKAHIYRGDIYEANFCQEFYATNTSLDPIDVFNQLNQVASAPFSAFLRLKDQYVMCASPERYLQKTNKQLISQPIKGTTRRGITPEEDLQLREELKRNTKERSENVMIVDLVRNDLTRVSTRGSIKVKELFGIYGFKTVNHMVSTIQSELREGISPVKAIRQSFPMGSMTGAPKISAMKIIEQCELTQRGLYSGAIGYITPSGDFDFNVVIRSLIYNKTKQYLSLHTGGAITADCIPEKEYEECLLKAAAILETLRSSSLSNQL